MPHLIQALEEDHQRIRNVCDELKKACEGASEYRDQGFCRDNFVLLKKVVLSHAEAEEAALYDLFESSAIPRQEKLRDFSLQGYEEHALVEKLIQEMTEHRHIDDVWKAKLTVLSELLEHHLDEEEEEFFPKVRASLDESDLREIADAYILERDDLLQTFDEQEERSIGTKDSFTELRSL